MSTQAHFITVSSGFFATKLSQATYAVDRAAKPSQVNKIHSGMIIPAPPCGLDARRDQDDVKKALAAQTVETQLQRCVRPEEGPERDSEDEPGRSPQDRGHPAI